MFIQVLKMQKRKKKLRERRSNSLVERLWQHKKRGEKPMLKSKPRKLFLRFRSSLDKRLSSSLALQRRRKKAKARIRRKRGEVRLSMRREVLNYLREIRKNQMGLMIAWPMILSLAKYQRSSNLRTQIVQ